MKLNIALLLFTTLTAPIANAREPFPDMFRECVPVIHAAIGGAMTWGEDQLKDLEITDVKLVRVVSHQHEYYHYTAKFKHPWSTSGKVLMESSTGGCRMITLNFHLK